MKRKLSSIVLATALVVSLAAGAGGEDVQAAKKAKLGTKKITLIQGKTKKIKVKNKKKGCRYTFTSNKKKVATVTKKGKVKAVAAGTAKITVKEVSKKGKKRKIGVVKVLVKKNSQIHNSMFVANQLLVRQQANLFHLLKHSKVKILNNQCNQVLSALKSPLKMFK